MQEAGLRSLSAKANTLIVRTNGFTWTPWDIPVRRHAVTRWVAHLKQLLANTLALAALMHVEVKHRQWLRLDKRCCVLQQRTAQCSSQVVKLGTWSLAGRAVWPHPIPYDWEKLRSQLVAGSNILLAGA